MDLLFLLAVAIFIGVRLWQVLGQKPDGRPMGGVVFLKERDVEIKKHTATTKTSDFYPGFDESDFLEGAEAAFMMILKAHQTGDKKTLKELVTPTLLQTTFKTKPKDIPSNMCLTAVAIHEKHLEKNEAFVTVTFSLESVFQNKTVSSEDTWTFKRNIKSKNPNWILASVSNK